MASKKRKPDVDAANDESDADRIARGESNRAKRAKDFSALIAGGGGGGGGGVGGRGRKPSSFEEVDAERQYQWGGGGGGGDGSGGTRSTGSGPVGGGSAALQGSAATDTATGAAGTDADTVDAAAAGKAKEAANFALSGALSRDKNTGNVYNGVVLKWSEPPEARRPTRHWRLYVFKAKELLNTMHIHRQSAFLFGRERKVADIPVDHASCSAQHAVLQFRLRERTDETGLGVVRDVRPYIMDLESTHGTFLNGEKLQSARYIELRENDVLKLGASTREYVLMCRE